MHIVDGVLKIEKPYIGGIGHGFRRASWLGDTRFVSRKGVSVDERVSGCSPFDLSQANQITSFEISIPMLELP